MGIFKRAQQRRARKVSHGSGAIRQWARAGMRLTFRAEVMPGRERVERTFLVARVLASGRVELIGMAGQHAETEFEQARS